MQVALHQIGFVLACQAAICALGIWGFASAASATSILPLQQPGADDGGAPREVSIAITVDRGAGATYNVDDEFTLCTELSRHVDTVRIVEVVSGQPFGQGIGAIQVCSTRPIQLAPGQRTFRAEALESGEVVASAEVTVVVVARPAPPPVQPPAQTPGATDCGTDLGCLTQSARTCAPARVSFTDSVLSTTVAGWYAINPGDPGSCLFEMTYDELRIRGELKEEFRGRSATCSFTVEELVANLEGLSAGVRFPVDRQRCPGTLWEVM